jgi:hypothetical protein
MAVVISCTCPSIDSQPADVLAGLDLQNRLSKIRLGTSAAEVEEILGPADRVLSSGGADSCPVHVWRNRWSFFFRDTVLIEFEDGRVTMATQRSGDIRDPRPKPPA